MKKLALLGIFLMSINAGVVMAEDACEKGKEAAKPEEVQQGGTQQQKVDNRANMSLRGDEAAKPQQGSGE
jgi:hypothetical protein